MKEVRIMYNLFNMDKITRHFGVRQTIYQGSGCIRVIPDILKAEGWKRVLLVAGPTFLKLDACRKLEAMLKDGGFEYRIFSDIRPNPTAEDVEKIGLPMYREMKADVLLAVGGGSTLDSAKGIAIIGESDKTIYDIAGVMGTYDPYKPLPWKTYPMIAVPTTCGSGSEVIHNAVISEADGHKLVPMHDAILPAYAVCDPDLLATLPPHVAAASGMDALVQAIESLVSRAANDFSRTMSFRAIELMGPVLVKYYHNRASSEYANAMSLGCMYAGFAWNTAFPAQVHGSNHPIYRVARHLARRGLRDPSAVVCRVERRGLPGGFLESP
jgi:alcohol dehydrogenase class IV